MYKLLLCWRYLRTRWIALASIISVTLGVATMIVVNSVMEGFRHEMQQRIHGILSDIVFESNSLAGFYDPDWHMEQIRQVAGQYIEGMTPTVVVPAMLSYEYNGSSITRAVQLIGIDERTQSQVGDFCHYLQHPGNREKISFDLRDDGYDVIDHQAGPDAPPRHEMREAGWKHRHKWVERQRLLESMQPKADRQASDPHATRVPLESLEATLAHEQHTIRPAAFEPALPDDGADEANPLRDDGLAGETPLTGSENSPIAPAATAHAAAVNAATHDSAQTAAQVPAELTVESAAGPINPFGAQATPAETFDPDKQQHPGAVIGISTVTHPLAGGHTLFLAMPGDDVRLSFPTAGTPPEVSHASFTIVDLYESKMSEYDASFVFVPIATLQQYRGMFDPETKIGFATSIQIKLKPGVDGQMVRDVLRAAFAPQIYNISTWRDKQGPLLAAVQMETAILNVLLFMIIFVAGFGILAIFFMIVVEKTRDIGILKALGASRRGILGIFLGYGLSLGIVGAGAGMVIGLLFVAYINEIADLLGMITGQEVFDPTIYYFQKIPTIIEPGTVTWIVAGALLIAVLASVLPARRAARLHPVEALRYE